MFCLGAITGRIQKGERIEVGETQKAVEGDGRVIQER